MKKSILLAILASGITALNTYALPTYEPFTEFGPAILSNGSNMLVSIGTRVLQETNTGTYNTSTVSGYDSYLNQCLDFSSGGFNDPQGEAWTVMRFGGTNTSVSSASSVSTNWIHGLDVAIINDSLGAVFPYSTVGSLLPSTFPGCPAPGAAITNMLENAAQPLVWGGTSFGQSPNIVGNSAVLNLSQDITRPASGSRTIYVSYLINVAQLGQLGSGNNGRYFAFVAQTNLNAGPGSVNSFPSWASMFNTFNTTTAPHYAAHGLLEKSGTSFYIGPCDTSAGKDFSTSSFTISPGVPAFVVGAYSFHGANNASASDTNVMWVNPGTSSFGGLVPPTTPIQVNLIAPASQMSDIAGLCFIDRIGNGASGGVGTNYIANVLVGTTWSYVTGGPEFTNQPIASTNVNVGQNLALTGQATAAGQAVTYQWQKISGGVTNNIANGTGGAGGTATISGAQSATITISGVSTGDVGTYQLVATAASTGYPLTSSPVAVALADPQIAANPANTTVNYNGTATFTAQVTTTHGPLQYCWYDGTTALQNGVQPDGSTATGASGTTAAGTAFTLTLTLSGVSYQDIGNYSLVVTNNLDLAASTTPAALSVVDPSIVAEPTNPVAIAGGNATFTVSAAGSSTIAYQWYENGNQLNDSGTTATGSAVVSGAQSATLTLTGVSDADDGSYYCAVSGSSSLQTTNSVAATLTVQDPLTVVTPPQSLTERAGDHTAFSVLVSGGGPSFQWLFNGTPITGATNSFLVLTNIQAGSAGTYSVVAENAATLPITNSATLTVLNNGLVPLATTNIVVVRIGDGAQTLSGATGNTMYLDQYTPNGTYVNTLQIPDEAAGAPYGAGSTTSTLGSPALLAQGAGSDSPNGALLTTSGGNNQFLDLAGYCLSYPFTGSDVTAAPSGAFWRGLATVDAFGIYSLVYTNTGLYNGGNHTIRSMMTLGGTNFWTTGQAGANGLKYVNSTVTSYATGSGIPVITSSATGTEVAEIVAGNLLFSDTGSQSILVCAGTPEPANSTTASSTVFIGEGGMPVDFAFSPDLATVYIADASAGIERFDTNVAGGYSFSYTIPVSSAPNVGACGLAVDFSASETWGAGVTNAVIYATTYGAASNSLVSVVDIGSSSTPTLITTVGGKNALRGVRFGPAAIAPFITGSPLSQTNFPGNTVSFSVSAGGSAPLYYQWYGPNGIIAGATNSTVAISGLTLGSSGGYYAVVSNPSGNTATSGSGVLTVTAGAPTISPGTLPNFQETVGDHLAWAPVVNGTVPMTYTWYQSGNPTPVATGTINALGAGAGGLSLANIQTGSSGTYTLVVSNQFGLATNVSGGVLTVTTAPQMLYPTNLVVSRIGDGVQTLSGATGNTMYLDQYTPAGKYVNTIQIPDEGLGQPYLTGGNATTNLVAGSNPLLFAGAGFDAPYEGSITLAPNGQSLAFVGYVEAYPFQGADVSVGGNGAPNWRGIGEVDAYGYYTLNYTNSGLYSGGNHQVHATADLDGNGTNFYTTGQAGGGNGLKYCNVDNEAASGLGIVSIGGSYPGTRMVQVVNGNVMFSDTAGASGVGIYGFSGLPTGASTADLLIAETNSPNDFAVSPDGSTVYITDNSAFAGTGVAAGGIERWDGTAPNNYTYSYTLATGAGQTAGARCITVDFSANSTWGAGVQGAKLYVTTAEASGNRLIAITDNGATSAATTLITAAPGQILSGVRFGPAVVAPNIAIQPQPVISSIGASATFSASAGGSGPFTYQWYFQAGGSGSFTAISGATNSSYTVGSIANGNLGNYYVVATSPSSATITSDTVSLSLNVPPHFTAETLLGNGQGFQMSFIGTASQPYTIYSTTDLTLPQTSWTPLTTGTFSGNTDTYTDPSGGTGAQEFYIITSP